MNLSECSVAHVLTHRRLFQSLENIKTNQIILKPQIPGVHEKDVSWKAHECEWEARSPGGCMVELRSRASGLEPRAGGWSIVC